MSDSTQEIIERARKDKAFLYQLVFDPSEAVKGLRLTDDERAALTASTPEGLIGAIVTRRGCGSTPTCASTCEATCKVTFTSRTAAAIE